MLKNKKSYLLKNIEMKCIYTAVINKIMGGTKMGKHEKAPKAL